MKILAGNLIIFWACAKQTNTHVCMYIYIYLSISLSLSFSSPPQTETNHVREPGAWRPIAGHSDRSSKPALDVRSQAQSAGDRESVGIQRG